MLEKEIGDGGDLSDLSNLLWPAILVTEIDPIRPTHDAVTHAQDCENARPRRVRG